MLLFVLLVSVSSNDVPMASIERIELGIAGFQLPGNVSTFITGLEDGLDVSDLQNLADLTLTLPNTTTRTTQSIKIFAGPLGRRIPIGAVHEISTSQTREVDEEYAISNEDRRGRTEPVSLIPQTLSGRSLTLNRYDLYGNEFEQAFGSQPFFMLSQQKAPISIRLTYSSPTEGSIGSLIAPVKSVRGEFAMEFQDCYFKTLGRTLSAEGNIISKANGQLVWKKLVPVA